ncbi:MAG TPA: protein-glutamate O-methyltransferase CheR [Gemmatimonadaceae bacterium]|jgi:chemotaxis methyl-accepting protein methylase|nr:protein-glutamate O-methyltransferase CheR [Gemmatimonadaceae bacterium]
MSDEGEFQQLLSKIATERQFHCQHYKEKCLRRRIGVRLRARGLHSYADYARLLDGDAREYEKLLDTLTINVTKLFRNWETWEAIAVHVIPAIWQEPRQVHVWSAGCSSGEEAYSLAVMFHRHASAVREANRLSRIDILGTDIDRESLTAAAKGLFDDDAFTDTPSDLRAEYFSPTQPATVRPEAKSLVRFERRDLIRGDAPKGLHLIACRNVIIYFDRVTQEQLFVRFHDALAPGGFLVLGKVETLLGATRSLFEPVDARERIFRRR